MKKLIFSILVFLGLSLYAQDTIRLDEITVTDFYRNQVNEESVLQVREIGDLNHGQEPSYILQRTPSIFAYSDNGTQMGYSYFRLRGMSQERMNITLDGMPWNEAEDFGCYFSNMPDLLSSMHSVKIERGASVTTNGTSSYAGNISFESVNLKLDTISYFDLGLGNFNSYKTTGVYNSGIRGKWGLHIKGTNQQTEGYKEHSYNNSQSFVLKAGYYFNSRHSLEFLSMTGFHKNGQGFMGLPMSEIEHPNPWGQIKNGCLPQETDNFFMTINKLQYKGILSDNLVLMSSVYWNHLKGDYRIMLDSLYNFDLKQNMLGGNVVASLYLDDFTLKAGVNAYYFTRRHSGILLPSDTIVYIYHDNNKFKERYANRGNKPDFNAFIQGTYNLGLLDVIGSVQYRYTSLDYNVEKAYDIYDQDNFHSWSILNGGLEFIYNKSAYFRFITTGKEPSRVDMFGGEYFTGEYCVDNPSDLERVFDFELGYDLKRSWIQANINLFYMDFKNELVATGELSQQNFLPLHKQKDSYRTGVELSSIFKSRYLWFTVNGSWSKNILKETGKAHTFSPTWTLFGEISYKSWCGVNINYRSDMYLDLDNEYKLPEAWNLGFYAMYRPMNNLELRLDIFNATNRLNVSSGSVDGGQVYYLVDSPFNIFGRIRVYL
jgi:iron complex outermembrane receptor protein